jgi:hypothetical protein
MEKNTKYRLFLDDFREPRDAFFYKGFPIYNDDWTVVRNYLEFVKTIEILGIPEAVSFDHDLADVHYEKTSFDYDDEYQEKTGYHCAKWLIDYCINNKKELPTTILIHSMNVVGSQNIKSLFESYFKSLKL